MKKTLTKILSVLLIFCITLTSAPLSGLMGLELPEWLDFSITSKAATYSGACGDNITWNFDDETGTLTISGTGAMKNFSSSNRPWKSYEDNIKNVIINNSVTTIGDYAFYNCTSLTSVTIPDSVTSIGTYAFRVCSSLTSVSIGNSVITIDSFAFGNCDSLTSITIPNSVTTIGGYAFYHCDRLTGVTMGDSVSTIGSSAFSGCSSLISITIPESVTTIGSTAFDGCVKLEKIYWNATKCGDFSTSAYIFNSAGKSSDGIELVFGDNVEKIPANFCSAIDSSRRPNITSITIGKNVKSIGGSAFSGCSRVTSATIPNSVTSIGSSAFSGCSSLKDVIIPDGVTTIGSSAFRGCYSLTSITIPDSVTEIGGYAFYLCNRLTSVTISNSVTTIGSYTFYNCTSLTSVIIGNSVTTIGNYAFEYCKSLTSVTIPDSVTTIGDSAFYYCESLTDVHYLGTDSQWKTISISSDNQCLKEATIHYAHTHKYELEVTPSTCIEQGYTTYTCECGYSYVDDYANLIGHTNNNSDAYCDVCTALCKCGDNLIWSFDNSTGTLTISGTGDMYRYYDYDSEYCDDGDFPWNYLGKDIKKIIVEEGVTQICDFSFAGCSNLTSVVFPNTLDEIGAYSFSKCTGLTNISISGNNTSIEYYAFRECINLCEVTLGDGVNSIDDYAFYGCNRLSDITVGDSITWIGKYVFSSSAWYKNDDNWDNGVLYLGNYLIDANPDIISGEITVRDGTKVISSVAFKNCYSLKKINFPYGLRTIGYDSFCSCNNLTGIDIPSSVSTIGAYAFYGCSQITSVTIPKGITHISDAVFDGCYNLTTVTIPQSVRYIGWRTFCDCDNIKDVYYYGTEEEWNAIVRDAGNGDLGGNVHFHEHMYNEWEIIDEPTCLKHGYKIRFCDCGKRNGVYTDALGHDIIIDEAVNPDCINTGLTVGEHCSRCDYKVEQTVVDALGHNYDSVITSPTCTDRGYTTYDCTVCADTYTSDYIGALGHTAGEIVEENYVAPTCTTNGSKDNVTYCTVCSAETSRETITIPSLGHTEEEIPAVTSTCTETGLSMGIKCSVCDEILEPQQEIPALGHDIITDEAVLPDCTNTGLTAGEHCSRCDHKVEQTVVDALGHKYDSVITAPTCTSEGYTTYTCHCGDTYTGDFVDALAHNYKDGICADCETSDPTYFTFEIQKPSRTTIRCNDGIKLHTKITGKLTDGSRIEWSKNNNNFNMTTSASGNEITIISKNNGYTTFTAIVYDADNNVIAQDTIEIYSKAGLFDKIGGFFRSLFGSTKIYDN